MDLERTPVLVGVAQLTQRDVPLEAALSAPDMLERVARAAFADAGAGVRAQAGLDVVAVVAALGWRNLNPPQGLADRLGAGSARAVLTAVGGEMPLRYRRSLRARDRGGTHPLRARLRHAQPADAAASQPRRTRALSWDESARGTPEPFGENKAGNSEQELAYGLDRPSSVYPIFENALRARRGLDLATHRLRMGRADEPLHARRGATTRTPGSRPARSAEELTTPSAAEPHGRLPVHEVPERRDRDRPGGGGVDHLGGGRRAAHGVPKAALVYLWGGGARGRARLVSPASAPTSRACPALAAAARARARRAPAPSSRRSTYLDLYSCFPVAVEMACEMLGLDEADPRGFTRDRRAALRRRARQRLHAARARVDGGAAARGARLARAS